MVQLIYKVLGYQRTWLLEEHDFSRTRELWSQLEESLMENKAFSKQDREAYALMIKVALESLLRNNISTFVAVWQWIDRPFVMCLLMQTLASWHLGHRAAESAICLLEHPVVSRDILRREWARAKKNAFHYHALAAKN